jgi:hypothetical protein
MGADMKIGTVDVFPATCHLKAIFSGIGKITEVKGPEFPVLPFVDRPLVSHEGFEHGFSRIHIDH